MIRIHQYCKLRMIPNKLAEQFILLNLTSSFLPLTNKYALCPFERSICSFLRLIQREARKVELCVSNGSQRPEQTEIQLNGKSNKNSAKTTICAENKIFSHGCLSVTGLKKALTDKNCFAFNTFVLASRKLSNSSWRCVNIVFNADSPIKI